MIKDVIIYKHERGTDCERSGIDGWRCWGGAEDRHVGRRTRVCGSRIFTANIRNSNTRRAYHRACCDFFRWCKSRGLTLDQIGPVHVATYIEILGKELSRPTVKQQLAAIRMLFDWLVVGQAVPFNPASSVADRGSLPRRARRRSCRPRRLANFSTLSIRLPSSVCVIVRSSASWSHVCRVGAATGMDVEDWYFQGRRWWVRLVRRAENPTKMPAHHSLKSTWRHTWRPPASPKRKALPSSGRPGAGRSSSPKGKSPNRRCTS